MSRIRSKDTKIDRLMEKMLVETGHRYEKYPKIYGNPDFTIQDMRIAIFCDGDFWHGYKYDEKKKPTKKFWRDKIEGNMIRDRLVSRKLRREGWAVLRFWEHDIERHRDACISRIIRKARERRGLKR